LQAFIPLLIIGMQSFSSYIHPHLSLYYILLYINHVTCIGCFTHVDPFEMQKFRAKKFNKSFVTVVFYSEIKEFLERNNLDIVEHII
jgi:hypothetical protein